MAVLLACAAACEVAGAQYYSPEYPPQPPPYPSTSSPPGSAGRHAPTYGPVLAPADAGPPSWIQPLPPTEPLFEPTPSAETTEFVPAEAVSKPLPIPSPLAWLDPWTGSFEFGLSGSEGNGQTFTLHLGAESSRRTRYGELALEWSYSKGTNNGIDSEHEALLDGRHEWQFEESCWTAFLHGNLEYDEFRAFDARLSADAGVGYSLIKTETTKLTTRVGGGGSRELGGPDASFVPEGLAGLRFERKLTKRQKLAFSVEYLPDVTDFGDFRANSKAAWEMLVDPEMNLNLKLSVTDRYDSTPGGAKRNDLDYSLLLLWNY